MDAADITYLVGSLFVAYTIGWVSGFLILTFKRASDLI